MNASRLFGNLCVLGAAFLFFANVSNACTTAPPIQPPQYWIINHGDPDGDGLNEYWVGQEIDLFPFSQPTFCQCGLGFSGPLNGQVKDLMVTVVDRLTHQIIGFVNAFDTMKPDDETTAELSANFPDASWTGLGGVIDPAEFPQLPETQAYKLWFKVLAPTLDGLAAVTAAGARDDPNHPLRTFQPEQTELIPPDPVPVDHLKCYKIRGEKLLIPLGLSDQFHEERVEKKIVPELLCNPVVKRRTDSSGQTETTGITVGAHYVCYRIKADRPPLREVLVDNQFGMQKFRISRSRLLCLPSTKWHVEN